MANKTLSEQNKAERAFYLGKLKATDKVPGSDKTIAEARESYQEANDKHEKDLAKKAEEFRKENPPAAPERVSVVTHETVVPLKAENPEPEKKKEEPKKLGEHTEESLSKLKEAEVVTIATDMGLTVVPGSQTIPEMRTMILDAQKAAK